MSEHKQTEYALRSSWTTRSFSYWGEEIL